MVGVWYFSVFLLLPLDRSSIHHFAQKILFRKIPKCDKWYQPFGSLCLPPLTPLPSLSHFLASFTYRQLLLMLMVTQKKVAVDKSDLQNQAELLLLLLLLMMSKDDDAEYGRRILGKQEGVLQVERYLMRSTFFCRNLGLPCSRPPPPPSPPPPLPPPPPPPPYSCQPPTNRHSLLKSCNN